MRHIALAHGIEVNVVELLQKEGLGFDDFRLVAGFPEPEGACFVREQLEKSALFRFHVAADFMGRVAFEITKARGGVRCADNHVQMIEHEDIGV